MKMTVMLVLYDIVLLLIICIFIKFKIIREGDWLYSFFPLLDKKSNLIIKAEDENVKEINLKNKVENENEDDTNTIINQQWSHPRIKYGIIINIILSILLIFLIWQNDLGISIQAVFTFFAQ